MVEECVGEQTWSFISFLKNKARKPKKMSIHPICSQRVQRIPRMRNCCIFQQFHLLPSDSVIFFFPSWMMSHFFNEGRGFMGFRPSCFGSSVLGRLQEKMIRKKIFPKTNVWQAILPEMGALASLRRLLFVLQRA